VRAAIDQLADNLMFETDFPPVLQHTATKLYNLEPPIRST
jgi:hypothetical protein